ncbi:alpha/beta-hydrolase [Dentipellis sp. KUC8613]|nr:alpha/beta-hydrolase [Dentipellis sp. KUC8613]
MNAISEMNTFLDKYGRLGIDYASAASSVGFAAAKAGTRLGFGITRGIASSAAGLTGSALDYAFFGGKLGTGDAFGSAVASAITAVEQLALLPILLGESLTSASIVAAYSSINALTAIFPGSDEASFSLASFITLVQREWNEPALHEHLPEEKYGVTEVARALVGWGALQGVTHDWQVKKWMKYMHEIPFHDESDGVWRHKRTESRISVTSDTIFSGNKGQLITADIEEVGDDPDARLLQVNGRSGRTKPPSGKPLRMPNSELKHTLRRLSKMVLAGYGGASLLFFGVSPTPDSKPSSSLRQDPNAAVQEEKEMLAQALDASEETAAKTRPPPSASGSAPPHIEPGHINTPPAYSWWDVLLGRHDREIFMQYAGTGAHGEKPISAVLSDQERMPRFWVLTDHARRQIVLVFRGTMSLNEIAVDLTCDPEEFEPASAQAPEPRAESKADVEEDEKTGTEGMPGMLPFPHKASTNSLRPPAPRMRSASFMSVASFASVQTYQVHGGMLRMARAMGSPGRPVHVAVKEALKKNKGYELVMCGHSLGAGVAALLAMMWADPASCATVRSSGLPVGRRVSVYCIAPPCIACPRLSALTSNMITSFVYSHDVVSRLSLGSIRDMNRASAWLCKANANGGAEGYSAITKRALKWKTGFGTSEDPVWFLSIRKTLEANMTMSNLFPPGRVLWAVHEGDLEDMPPLQGDAKYSYNAAQTKDKDRTQLRLFEVLDVEKVFSQIVFARDMLSSHMPHQYDRVLEELQ